MLLSLLLAAACNQQGQTNYDAEIISDLHELYEQENFFKLKTLFEKHTDDLPLKDKIYFQALIQSAFNQNQASIRSIELALGEFDAHYTDTMKYHLNQKLFIDYYRQSEYELALRQCSTLLSDYRDIMNPAKLEHLENDQRILEALRFADPQEINKTGNSWINMFRDEMELLNVRINIHGDSVDFLFDTGSSFSFIRRSIAEKYNLKIYDVDVEVEGANGLSVLCDITLLDEFTVGNIQFKNVLLWVFDDPHLTLPEYNYSVNGALGFPVALSLEEVHIVFGDRIFVPAFPIDYGLFNMALDDHDPVVAIVQEGDTLPYYLDTGSEFSSLYKPYYDENADYIDSIYEQQSYSIGGLGGVADFHSFIKDSMHLSLSDKSAWVYNVEILSDYIYKDHEKVHGNLGQDFLVQFDKMIICSKYCSLVLE